MQQNFTVKFDDAALEEFIKAEDWDSAFGVAASLSSATYDTFEKIAGAASNSKIRATALVGAARNSSPPSREAYAKAILAAVENGLIKEAVQLGVTAVTEFPADPLLTAFSSLAEAYLRPGPVTISALRAAMVDHPEQFGSFYQGFQKVMESNGTEREGIEDLREVVSRLAQSAPLGTALKSAKITLARLLFRVRELESLVPLIAELQDMDIPHLQPELELMVADIASSEGWSAIASSIAKHGQSEASGFFVELLSGRTPDRDPPKSMELNLLALSQFRFVNLSKLEPGIEAIVSQRFLDIAKGGARNVARALRESRQSQPWDDDNKISDRLKDILDIVSSKKKRAFSPFSGDVLETSHMLDEECFVINDNGRVAVVAQWAATDSILADTTYILFDEKLVLYWPEAGLQDLPKRLLALSKLLAKRVDDVVNLVRSECREIGIAELFVPHIGHYIWNCISGWDAFFTYGGGEHVNFFAVHSNCKTLGSVGELYSDKVGSADRVVFLDKEKTVESVIYDQHAMVLTLRNNHITEGLAQRVMAWAWQALDHEKRHYLHSLREEHSLVVLVTIRLDNRCWVDQREGLPPLLNELHQRYPQTCFVLDGINSNVVQGWTHASMSVRDEETLAADIIRQCPGVSIYSSIGCPPEESIALAQLCDLYIAPVGAGMAKYRWIANLPGVTFSNKTFSTPNDFHGHLYDFYRDNAVKGNGVPADRVSDVADGPSVGNRANFSMDWREILPLATEIMDQIKLRRES